MLLLHAVIELCIDIAAMELDNWDVATVGRWLENAGYGGPSDSDYGSPCAANFPDRGNNDQ